MKKLLWLQRGIVILLLCAIVFTTRNVGTCYMDLSQQEKGLQLAQRDINEFIDASDYLTEQARLYAETENIIYLYNYFSEIEENKRRETAISNLKNGGGEDIPEVVYLQKAYDFSNELAQVEYHSMRLVANVNYLSPAQLPDGLKTYDLSEEESKYDHKQALIQARYLLFNNTYLTQKQQITQKTKACCQLILTSSQALEARSTAQLNSQLALLYLLVIILFLTEFCLSIPKYLYSRSTSNNNETKNKQKRKKKRTNNGFTHFDMVITIVVTLLLLALLAPTFYKYLNRSRDAKAEQNATEYKKVVEYILVDSLMSESGTTDNSEYASYQALSTRFEPPNESSYETAQRIYKQLDMGTSKYDAIALIKDNMVFQIIYHDISHDNVYVWFSSTPSGSILTQKKYSDQIDVWLRFRTTSNENWEKSYAGLEASDICWNGFSDSSKHLLK